MSTTTTIIQIKIKIRTFETPHPPKKNSQKTIIEKRKKILIREHNPHKRTLRTKLYLTSNGPTAL